jgi:hypothetical protein
MSAGIPNPCGYINQPARTHAGPEQPLRPGPGAGEPEPETRTVTVPGSADSDSEALRHIKAAARVTSESLPATDSECSGLVTQ